MTPTEPKTDDTSPLAAEDAGIRCDFCGEYAPSVRRIALDRDYERLLTPHKERFACHACSAAKEAERRGKGR
jgi:hypothetical protein